MWSLKIVRGSELAERPIAQWSLPQPLRRVSIGRDPTSDWLIADRTLAISAHHCEIVDGPQGPVLRDLSTNGTFVNGAGTRLNGEHVLRDGDRLELGPFEVLVAGPPMPPRLTASTPVGNSAPSPLANPRSLGVHTTAPQRGGDPAALWARGGGLEQQGLTEILRAAPPSVDSGLDLTRIREVPPTPKASAPDRAAVAPAAKPPAQPVSDLAQALARGLGVEVSTLDGQDLLQLVESLASAARAAHAALGPVSANMKAAKPKG